MKISKKSLSGIVLIFIGLIVGCSSNDDPVDPIPSPTNIESAKLSDFPLFGIQNTTVDIVDPVIENNTEITYGEITITVPSTVLSLDNIRSLITSSELDLSKFNISPSNNVALSYEDGESHVYTISTVDEHTEILHYNVQILKEVAPVPETLKITDFKFESSKNPSLTTDVNISHTVEEAK